MNQRGSVSFFVVFVFLAFILLVLFALFIPLMIDFNTEIYAGAEMILDDANASAAEIQDADIRAQLQGSIGASQDSIITQTDVLSTFFQYGYIIIILVIVLVIYMIARQTVEVGIR